MTLSTRQREIVELVGRDGLSYKAVARKLDISYSTVKVHVACLSRKLGSTRRPREAIIEYYCSGGLSEETVVL